MKYHKIYLIFVNISDHNIHIEKLITFNRGKFLMKKKKYQESADAFSKVLELDSDSVISLKFRAKCFYAMEKFNESKVDCEIGLNLFIREPVDLINFFLELLEKNKECLEKISESKNEHLQTFLKAEKFFEEAQTELSTMSYEKALESLKPAIDFFPHETKYTLAAADCYVSLEKYEEALQAIFKIIKHDKKCFQAYVIGTKCSLKLGKTECAEKLLTTFDEHVNDSLFRENLNHPEIKRLKALQLKIEETFEAENFEDCLEKIEEASKIATASSSYFATKVECLLRTKRFEEADKMISNNLNNLPNDADSIFLKGLKLYLQFWDEKSIKHFEDALIIQPNFKKCQEFYTKAKKIVQVRTLAEKQFQAHDFEEAVKSFSQLLTIDQSHHVMNTRILYRRGFSHYHLKHFKEAIDDFTDALKLDKNLLDSLKMRAKIHLALEEFADCIIDCEEYLKLEESEEVKKILEIARAKLKSSKPVDHYKVLGVSKNATPDEIRNAKRVKTLEFHTDKHPTATEIDKKKLTRKLNEVVAAYNYLIANADQKEIPKSETFHEKPKKSGTFFNNRSESSKPFYDQQKTNSNQRGFSADESSSSSFSGSSTSFENARQSSTTFRSAPPFVPQTHLFNPTPLNSSFGGGCNGMVREGNGFRPCKKTINRTANEKTPSSSNLFASLNFQNSSKIPECYSVSSGYSSSSSSNQCTAMVMDRSTKTMRQCRNTRNCPHH